MKKQSLILFWVLFLFFTVKVLPQTSFTVDVEDFQFVPKNLTITLGDTVKWVWISGTHTTTSDSTSGPDSWDSPINQQNPTFSFVIKYPGVHSYYCKFHLSLDMTGTITVVQPTAVIENNQLPSKFVLQQNFPNPFNPQTEIKYTLAKTVRVKLSVYNITGMKITDLVNGIQSPGNYSVKFDGRDLASGIYFYRLVAGNYTDVKKMILMK